MTTAEMGSPARLFPWIQALRAIAAFSVAFAHVAHDAEVGGRDPSGLIATVSSAMPWIAGVDIFFVISGFVVVHASANLFAAPGGPTRFLRRRMARIVPLYWMLTTLFLATLLFQPSAVHAAIGGGWYILASYLFLPWPRPDGLVQPALGLGWTLNYEMFFYLTLTPFLLLPRKPAVFGCAITLCLVVATGQMVGFGVVQLNYWADPIILEFVLGIGIAAAVAAGLKLPGWLRLAMVAAALVALYISADASVCLRTVCLGLPGAMMVAAATSARRPEPLTPMMRLLVRLGDASYAMYLVHPFVIRGFTLLGSHIPTKTEASGITYTALSLISAQICALAIHVIFERKITGILKGQR